jgi:hypothetical protein
LFHHVFFGREINIDFLGTIQGWLKTCKAAAAQCC